MVTILSPPWRGRGQDLDLVVFDRCKQYTRVGRGILFLFHIVTSAISHSMSRNFTLLRELRFSHQLAKLNPECHTWVDLLETAFRVNNVLHQTLWSLTLRLSDQLFIVQHQLSGILSSFVFNFHRRDHLSSSSCHDIMSSCHHVMSSSCVNIIMHHHHPSSSSSWCSTFIDIIMHRQHFLDGRQLSVDGQLLSFVVNFLEVGNFCRKVGKLVGKSESWSESQKVGRNRVFLVPDQEFLGSRNPGRNRVSRPGIVFPDQLLALSRGFPGWFLPYSRLVSVFRQVWYKKWFKTQLSQLDQKILFTGTLRSAS